MTSDRARATAPELPAPELPTVSVVVPTYRRRDGLEAVLAPLLADPAATQVVVVVDGSDDGSYELLQDLARRHRSLVPVLTDNQGPAAARQHGIDLATGDVVLMVDDDVVAAPGLVTGHARHHADEDDLVVLGYMPTRLPAAGTRGAFATVLYAAEYEAGCTVLEQDPEQVLMRLWGGNLSVRREQLARVPFASPEFVGTYHEDSDFGIRCLKAGLRGRFDRSLLSSHEHHRSMPAFRRDARRQGAGRYELHRLHPDVLPAYDLSSSAPGGPGRPAAAAVAVLEHPRVLPVLLAVLATLTTAASRLGLRAVEMPGARLVRRLELRRGVRQAAAD